MFVNRRHLSFESSNFIPTTIKALRITFNDPEVRMTDKRKVTGRSLRILEEQMRNVTDSTHLILSIVFHLSFYHLALTFLYLFLSIEQYSAPIDKAYKTFEEHLIHLEHREKNKVLIEISK